MFERFSKIISATVLLSVACNPPPCITPDAGAQKYIVVEEQSGLGNRLMAVASAMAVAKQKGRQVVLSWEPSDNELPARFEELFVNPYQAFENVKLPQGWQHIDILDPKIKCEPLVKRWSAKTDTYTDLTHVLDDPAQFIVVRHVHHPYGSADRPAANFRDYSEYLKSLIPVQSVETAVEQFYQTNLAGKRVVSVHYRSWKLSADVHSSTATAPKQLFANKMNEALTEDPQTVFFVATDALDVVKWFSSQFPGKIFSFPHLAIERGSLEDVKGALIDWSLAGRGEYLIASYGSTFSQTAAIRTKQKRLIALGPWHKPDIPIGELFCFDKQGMADQSHWNLLEVCPAHYPN